MKGIITIILAVMSFVTVRAFSYRYSFSATPVSEALLTISKDHPELEISFIYKELDNYTTSAIIDTEDPYEALRQTIGFNPVSIIRKDNEFFMEALQHGLYIYRGRVLDPEMKPVEAATVMLLMPSDSAVVTYGITDEAGRFAIPCDHRGVIAKASCVGFMTTLRKCGSLTVGDIVLPRLPIQLKSVSVEGNNAVMHSDRSVYIPTSRQKKSAQTAQDLIGRMAIPQLKIGSEIVTNSNQPVALYIDYVPASESDLSGMRTDDVKRVEYYDYPADPRFQGNPHVINFIMQQYEYGGYVKGIGYENFVSSRQLNGYAKLQYKKMTYDWAGGVFSMNDKHGYEEMDETYRLPQSDGTVKTIERSSRVDEAQKRWDSYWTSIKAMYRSDKVTLSNMISANFDRAPREYLSGSVTYTPAEYATTDYTSLKSSRVNSLIYSGYWYITLPHGNSLTFNPSYAYTHTCQQSVYDENGLSPFINNARDNSHQANGTLTFVHSFGRGGTLRALCQGRFLQNSTTYSGTSDTSDRARTFRLGPGVSYSYNNDHVSTNVEGGLHWDRSVYGSITENSTAPWTKVSLQYSPDTRHSATVSLDYSKSIPASSFRSANVVQANPLMSYTGNPSLVPYNSFLLDANYTYIRSNRLNLSAFGWAWIVDNRYVYDYEATATGVIRTIKQPMGNYTQWHYGIMASSRLLDNNLQLGSAMYMSQAHNGAPYNWTKSNFVVTLSAYYYLGNWYFGGTYCPTMSAADGCMVGDWMKNKSIYTMQIGWSNDNWNLRFFTRNFLRHNTYQTRGEMDSPYYSTTRYQYSASNAGFFQISATYTFSFGKKVKRADEAYQATGASTGILK